MSDVLTFLCYCCCVEEEAEDDSVMDSLIPNPLPPSYDSTCTNTNPLIKPPGIMMCMQNNVLLRREYATMLQTDQDRFLRALRQMTRPMQDNVIVYFSPFFQIASYVRWPMNYSENVHKHMMYLWYRAYLSEFETVLQQADIECGGDGKITIPYINISKNPSIPSALINFQFPEEYYQANIELAKVNSQIKSDSEIRVALAAIKLGMETRASLDDKVSKILDAYGFGNNNYAAFNPAFLLIICGIDMLYTKCVDRIRDVTPQSAEYWKILVPFRKLPSELIDTCSLGYKYS
jgi:hypothetical protein